MPNITIYNISLQPENKIHILMVRRGFKETQDVGGRMLIGFGLQGLILIQFIIINLKN